MVSSTVALVLVGLLVVVNQVVMRVRALSDLSPVFWGNIGLQAAASVGAAVWGLPGAEHVNAVRWLVAVLFGLHVVQNLSLRRRRRAEAEAAPGTP